jgi:hypothetical protein
MLARLAHVTVRHRRAVIGTWILLTLVSEPCEPGQAGV